MIIFLIYKI